jgi:hypothetical protein
MALVHHVAAVVITETLGSGGQLAVSTLETWLEDPAGRLPKALIGAAEDSRRVLELALQRQTGGLSGWLGRYATTAERRGLADAISGFLDAQPLLLAFVDIDNFKLVNDAGGQAAGDAFLRSRPARIEVGQVVVVDPAIVEAVATEFAQR